MHAALAAGLSCPLASAFADIPIASPDFAAPPPEGAPVRMARGIGVLSPVQPIPVRPAPSIDSRAVPLDPSPCDLQVAEPAMDTSVQGVEDGAAELIPGIGSSLSGAADAPPLGCEQAAAAPAEESTPDYSFGLEDGDLPRVPVVVISGVSRPTRPWFASVSGQDGLRYGGDRHWVYRNTAGPSVTVGNINANAPAWGSSAPVGGLQIANWAGSSATVPEGSFGYSSSLGKLNRMDPTASSGAVDYGASVGTGSVRYGLTPALTLEGQMQSAPSLTTRGMGTT
ncbi:MAG: fimbrial protein, partial [Achromobacter sp.]